jgi:hypothetical protein
VEEEGMISWIVRFLMIAAGVVTSWFVAKDAVNFGVIQMMVALMLLTLIVAVLAFWPSRWTIKLERLRRST